jgi:transposase
MRRWAYRDRVVRSYDRRASRRGREVAKMLGVSERTLFRGLKAARDHDELLGV